MSVSHLVLFCSVGLVAAQLRAVPPIAARTPEKNNRNILAESPITFSSVHVDGPYIAMTFDDGPSATLTPKLLDILAAHRIKATFFVIGENVAEHPEIVARAAREGHEIGNHSWSHPNFGKMSDDGVRSQLQRTDDAIKSAIGSRPTLLRPPYGSITAREKRWIHDQFGYEIILWDVDPYDWKRPGPPVVRRRGETRWVNRAKPTITWGRSLKIFNFRRALGRKVLNRHHIRTNFAWWSPSPSRPAEMREHSSNTTITVTIENSSSARLLSALWRPPINAVC
jgi:peptidoglycan/xylan/chitin deacetylase (PgdA/CDA1 family)